jgi:UDP-N-acetylmuramoylalanine--D-glutamate ligase
MRQDAVVQTAIKPGQRVLIWGFGRHGGGPAAARFCAAQGAQVTILDLKPASAFGDAGAAALAAGWGWAVGDATHPQFLGAELIVASPAVPPRAWPAVHPPRCSPEALFFAAHAGPRIAITGTKGKSTTAHILATLLGWQVAGNSYEPLLEILARHGSAVPLVCELSSFQLWYLAGERPRFNGAVFTSLAVDHLDWHPDLNDYNRSKITLMEWADAVALAPELQARVAANIPRVAPELTVTYRDGAFHDLEGVVALRADLPLLGEHNARNGALAVTMARQMGLARATVVGGLRRVHGLPHRLEFVPGRSGLCYCNDSIATTPEAAMAALTAIEGPLVIILGGSDKGADYATLAAAVVARGAQAILIGATAERLAACLRAAGSQPVIAGELSRAVALARQAVLPGGTVLLSPACASFDQFQGFEDRGARFRDFANSV